MKARFIFFGALILGLALSALSGCKSSNALVPKSVLDITDPNGKHTRIELPKDMDADAIDFTKGADGAPILSIRKIKVRTNPEVINAAGAAQADAINAAGDKILKGVELGVGIGKKAIGAP